MSEQDTPEVTPYDLFGGEPFFTDLVSRFYARVATDDVLAPMYPDHDLAAAERRLRLFLMQYWGGPGTYSEERGHPRLRMRHVDFRIDGVARDRWLTHMSAAMDEMGMQPAAEVELWKYFVGAAFAMQNVPDDLPAGSIPVGESADPRAREPMREDDPA